MMLKKPKDSAKTRLKINKEHNIKEEGEALILRIGSGDTLYLRKVSTPLQKLKCLFTTPAK